MKLKELNKQITALNPGEKLVLRDIAENVYHAAYDHFNDVKAIGSTDLVTFINAPAKFKHAMDKGPDAETAEHFLIGSASHCLLLEEELFHDKFAVMPESIKRKAGKEWEAFKVENAGKDILSIKQFITANEMANSTRDEHGQFFSEGESEISYFTRDKDTGLIVKARIDYQVGDLAIDYKTTKDAHPTGFQKAILNLHYYIQAAHYLAVSGLSEFAFVPVEKAAPYLTSGPFNIGQPFLNYGRNERTLALKSLAECVRNNVWPGYKKGLVTCELPYYLIDRADELENKINFGA